MSFQAKVLSFLRRLNGLLGCLFALQAQVVEHPSHWKALLTPRRAGKTELACAYLLDSALKHPGKKFLYVALTRPSAFDIAWGIFHRLSDEFGLNAHFHDSRLDITLPNGSKILLRGADQPNWIARLEGQDSHIIVIHESGLYNVDLRRLVYGSFRPMVMKGGTVLLIGRPGDVKSGFFWDLTRPDLRPGPKGEDGSWTVTDHEDGVVRSVFSWTTQDNPYMAEWWKKTVAEMMAVNPKALQTPLAPGTSSGSGWRMRTATSTGPSPSRGTSSRSGSRWTGDLFGMATDFGWDDHQSFVLGCWNPNRPDFVVLESYKEHHMPLAAALDRIAMYQARYPGLVMWGDPARKQLYMEMAIRFGAAVNVADKTEKHDYIDLMNNDFALGRIKLVRDTNVQYIKELTDLKKLVKEDGTWIEHPKQSNDCCDAGLTCGAIRGTTDTRNRRRGPSPGHRPTLTR